MVLTDWFDPYNMTHIRAWQHVSQTGAWPEGFIPEDVEVNRLWQVTIPAKMADAWVDVMSRGVVKTWDNPNPQYVKPVDESAGLA